VGHVAAKVGEALIRPVDSIYQHDDQGYEHYEQLY